MEPDQIDMMKDTELREELRRLVKGNEELKQRLKAAQHETIVKRTGYLCEIGGTKTFVIADNVASAMDCLERKANGEDYSMQIHHSIPVILDA